MSEPTTPVNVPETKVAVKQENPFSLPGKRDFTNAGVNKAKQADGGEILNATRRPTNGMTLSADTPASLSVRTTLGTANTQIRNSSVKGSSGYANSWFTTNFLLQSVTTSRNEKFQEIETFGPTYGFFFGERPTIINAQALLLTTPDFPWVVEWWWNYSHALSGTRLTESNSRVYLEYNDMILEGYIINCQVVEAADQPNSANLTFGMWVTQIDYKIDPGKPYAQAGDEKATFTFGTPVDTDVRTWIRTWTGSSGPTRTGSSLDYYNEVIVPAAAVADTGPSNFFDEVLEYPYGTRTVLNELRAEEYLSKLLSPEQKSDDPLVRDGEWFTSGPTSEEAEAFRINQTLTADNRSSSATLAIPAGEEDSLNATGESDASANIGGRAGVGAGLIPR